MADAPGALVRIGVVARAHGIRGEVAIRHFEPGSRTLLGQRRILLGRRGAAPEPREVEAARMAGDVLLVRLAGIGDRDAAMALAGCEVFMPRSLLAAPEPGEFYVGDLIGLLARRPDGEVLGRVEGLVDTGAVPVLEIRGEREWQVPLAAPFVLRIDIAAGEAVVVPVEEDEAPEA